MFDLKRARELMAIKNLDAVIVSSPANFYYVSGFQSYGGRGARGGRYTAILPKEENQEPALVNIDWECEKLRIRTWVQDVRPIRTWVHFEKEDSFLPKTSAKPEQFDPLQVVIQTLKEKGLEKGRLGLELDVLPYPYCGNLKASLPEATFVDAGGLLLEMKSVKTPKEIDKFRKAVRITEKGMVAATNVAREGVTEREIAKELRRVLFQSDIWYIEGESVCAGANSATPHGPFLDSSVYTIKSGDLLRFDVGVNLEGVMTDIGRTYVVGKASERWKKLHGVILKAQRRIVQSMKPGVKFSELFKIGMETVWEQGFSHYSRGHLGHSISYGPSCEEAPFISPKEDRTLIPGMILCVEVPYYILGLGGVNNEDMILITEDGHEELTTLERDLRSL